jgi:hypothetical protein
MRGVRFSPNDGVKRLDVGHTLDLIESLKCRSHWLSKKVQKIAQGALLLWCCKFSTTEVLIEEI